MFEEHKAPGIPSVRVHVPSENAGLVDTIFTSANCNEDTQGVVEGDSVWTGPCQFLNFSITRTTSVSSKVKDSQSVMFGDSDIFCEFGFHGGRKE